jgi:hypothetical protein
VRAIANTVFYEQAVYGSFPFWDKGYAILAHSPGCRPEWLAGLRGACQRFGERPAGMAGEPVCALFAMRLQDGRGPWMIVGVGSTGNDDRGRPGALAFHALFVSPRDYRRAGCDPFTLAGALRRNWTGDDATQPLPAGTLTIAAPQCGDEPSDPEVVRIAAALIGGRRVAVASAAPIDALARQVWHALPGRVRRRASVATWAFGNGNRFDLVALPRTASADGTRGGSDRDSTAIEERDGPPARGRRPGYLALAAAAGIVLFTGLAWLRSDRPVPGARKPHSAVSSTSALIPRAPDRTAYRDDPADSDPDERRDVTEALLDLIERFGIAPAGAVSRRDDPTALMVRLADRLRYRGPTLSPAELASLAAAPGREPALALRWHAQIGRFAADRPLPEDFARGPLRWQLDTLAWSFHLDNDGPAGVQRSAAEVPHALAEALASDLPLAPSGLSPRYPALVAYRDFLSRLPRR